MRLAVLTAVLAALLLVPARASAEPAAAFTFAPAAPLTGQSVEFTDASTDATSTIDDWTWTVDGEYAGDESTLSWTFDEPGTHEVSLTVEDADYDEATATTQVAVARAPSEQAAGGDVVAQLFYGDEDAQYQPVSLRIIRAGQVALERGIPKRCDGQCPVFPAGAYGHGSHSLAVRDLDRDGSPEVTLDIAWGNICCRETIVYGFAGGRVVAHPHNWGDSSPGRLVDVRHDGHPVWESSDGRIRYAFGCGGCVAYPAQVVGYRHGRFADVTRRYPGIVRADAARLWRRYRAHPRSDARPLLAPWAADEYRLGHHARVWRVVRHAQRAGRLRARGELDVWPQDARFAAVLRRWLHRHGY
jgi:hypothetical protein